MRTSHNLILLAYLEGFGLDFATVISWTGIRDKIKPGEPIYGESTGEKSSRPLGRRLVQRYRL